MSDAVRHFVSEVVVNDEVYVRVPPRSRVVFMSDDLAEQLSANESEPVHVRATLRGDLYAELIMRGPDRVTV